MVEGERGEGFADLNASGHDGEFLCRETRGDEPLKKVGRLVGELARLEHHPVACRECGNRRQKRELHRVVPRADHADHAERLAQDAAAARP